uniref:BOS complex subunit NCLN n=1 Tax=Tetranychus urticae TaxID=32264 RepID=T1K2J3_TETUR
MGDNLFGDFFRSSTSSNSARLQAICAMFTLIPILIFISNGPKVALATQEVTVYRMNHHDWLGNPYGSRSSLMNLEMRTAATLSRSYAKKCLLLKIDEIINSTENFEDFITNPMVGGMLIIIPDSFAKIGDEKRSKLLTLEKSLNSRSFDIPIYFVKEDANLIYMYQELSKESTDEAKTDQFIGADILNAITLDGYQLSISGPPPKPINEPIITNIETKLVGSKPDDQSTIVVVAHNDAFGISPGLSFGGDSNGSGVVALLELVRIFSKLYATRKVKPSFNLVFLLSGAGKFSYLGTKKWIEEHMDIKESGLLGDVQVSICLDSLGSLPDNSIYAHVPRVPKETTTTFKLFNHLSEIASKKDINATFTNTCFNIIFITKS